MRLSKLQKLRIPLQLTSAQWSLFCLWQLRKEEIEGVLQMRGAFIAAFTNQKRWMKN
jgi:hypothetical protein